MSLCVYVENLNTEEAPSPTVFIGIVKDMDTMKGAKKVGGIKKGDCVHALAENDDLREELEHLAQAVFELGRKYERRQNRKK